MEVSSQSRKIGEINALDRFSRQLAFFDSDLARQCKTSLDYWLLMQHYGCPTRCLDWSRSPYVALYFSVTEATTPSALFGLNLTTYQEAVGSLLHLDDYDGKLLTGIPDRYFRILEQDPKVRFPIPISPTYRTRREFHQQTMILVDTDLDSRMEDRILEVEAMSLCKIELPSSIRATIMNKLSSMNIDGIHLFGDIPGLAISAKDIISTPSTPD